VDDAQTSFRSSELGFTPEELGQWTPQLTAGTVAALLATLIRFEDALAELSSEGGREQP